MNVPLLTMLQRRLAMTLTLPKTQRVGALGNAALRTRTVLIVTAAVWGMIVDANAIPLLAPTQNSTIFQATTAAPFAIIGIIFGPIAGAAPGLIRDGSGYVITLFLHPELLHQHTIWHWSARGVADTLEDAILGWLPGVAAQRTRRFVPLTAAAALAAWISLPLLVIANTLIDGHFTGIWTALSTAVGDWDEPVDPGLTVYALLTGGIVALVLARNSTRPRSAALLGMSLLSGAAACIAAGAHP